MGQPMASHLLDAGCQLCVYNRTRAKARALEEKGAIWCTSPAEVAAQSSITFTIVGYPADVEAVYLGKDGIAEGIKKGCCAVDMTTTSPSLEVRIAAALQAGGAHFADVPVSGGDRGAREASLSMMAGCDDETFGLIRPYLEIMGRNISHCGPVGSGQQTKMCNQIVIAGTMIGVSEALVYGKKAGLDLDTMVSTIAKGAAGCWTLDNLAPRVIKGDFDPGFMIDHFIKDMKIAIYESRAMGLNLPGLRLVEDLYEKLSEEGYGRNGTQALVKAIEELAKDKG